uniref:Pleiotrophin/Midkine C-terminal domain-containing protein n=1 Tax=Magallana gigas TaxID=29159 RepID=K1RJS5_MAGGI
MQSKILLVLVVVLLAASITEAGRKRKNKGNKADRCIYKRDRSLGKPECIKGVMTFTLQLKSGPSNCTATVTKTKRCRNKECKYDVVSSECNQATNRMTKVMQLKEADKAAKKAARRERNKARKANKKSRKNKKNRNGAEAGTGASLQEPTA